MPPPPPSSPRKKKNWEKAILPTPYDYIIPFAILFPIYVSMETWHYCLVSTNFELDGKRRDLCKSDDDSSSPSGH